MQARKKTKEVQVGSVIFGGNHPIAIESMTSTDTRNAEATIRQISALAEAGCEIVRIAIPDASAASAFTQIKKATPVPLIADIHFDYRLALAVIEAGADKVRINPGNIQGEDRLRQVAEAASKANIPIRVGVNGGSLEKELLAKYGGLTAEALCKSALRHIQMLEALSFHNIAVSIKASNVPLTIAANQLLAAQTNYPIHIGITEAGTLRRGTIKSTAGIGALLAMGIGDSIRVSLCADPVLEIPVAKEILQVMGLRRFGVEIVACPTCGRCEAPLEAMANEVEAYCENIKTPITVAVMGCVVNGPGEAAEADFGVACGKREGVVFAKGKIVEKVPNTQLAKALITKIAAFCPETKMS